jgi:protein O-mannosyl-transferase
MPSDELVGTQPESSLAPEGRPPVSLMFASCLAAIALILGVYANSLHNGFHFDDNHTIVGNIYIRDLANIPHFFTDARTFSAIPANASYRPLVSLTFAIDYWLGGGLDPFWFHVTQITLLIATGALLFLFYERLFGSATTESWRWWAALYAATLFCVHTANTQAVNYIAVRSELLSGLGVLGGFMIYVVRPAWRRYYIYLLPVIVGAFAKTPAVMFAPLLFFYILFIEEQLSVRDLFSAKAWPRVRRSLVVSAPAFVLAIALFFFIEGHNAPTLNNGGAGRAQYLLTQTWMWVRYVRLFFLPTGLTADTDLKVLTSVLDPRVIVGILILLVSLASIWRTSQRRELRPVAFGITWFWIALIPASSIFPLQEVTNDHRMFFPYMGLTAAVVWWICIGVTRLELPEAMKRRLPQVAAGAALLALGGHAIGTYHRNRVWLSEETLWQDVVAKSPRNPRGLMNYGLTQMAKGQNSVARDYFTRAYGISPNYPILSINLGIVTDAMGDSSGAEGWFERALALDPNYSTTHTVFANWLVRRGRAPEAVAHLERAVELSPADLSARHSLLDLYAASGDTAKLRALARQTLAAAVSDSVAMEYSRATTGAPGAAAQWYQQGLAHTGARQHALAAYAYRVSVSIDSTNADAWNNLGWTLGALGFIQEAVPALERAIALRPDYTLARNNLAWARRTLLAAGLKQLGAPADKPLGRNRLR